MPDQMREALEAAYDKHAEEAPETPAPVESPQEAAAPEAAPEKAQSAATEAPTPPVKDGGEKSPPAAVAPPAAHAAATGPTGTNGTATTPTQSVAKPPRSWSAEAKAAFAALPEPVKQDVLRREKEISQGLELAAPARKHYESFQEVIKPFQPMFDAYGVQDSLPVIRQLLATRATFEIGTPEQKAQLVANIIHDFGIDIQQLDSHLVKKGPVQPFRPARPAPPAPLDPRLEQIINRFEAKEKRDAEAAVEAAESLPHFDDLREDMADILEAWAIKGIDISADRVGYLKKAHIRALAMNPSLEPAPAAPPVITKSQAAAILASRNAASSISGTPRTGASPAPTDRRSQIAAAWDANRAS